MPRPSPDNLVAPDEVDPRPLVEASEFTGVLERLVRWSDSPASRRKIMAMIDFPVDEVPIFLIVNQLVYRGAMRPKDLADALGMGRPNITKLSSRACDLGLVARVAEPGDERAIRLVLTAEGRRLGAQIVDSLRLGLADLLSSWSARDAAALQNLLTRYVDGIEQAYPI